MENILLSAPSSKIKGIRNMLSSIIKEEVKAKPAFKVTYIPMKRKAKVIQCRKQSDLSTEAED